MQRLRTSRSLDSSFLYRLLNSPIGREQLNFWGTTTTGLANLNGTVIGNLFVALPRVDEQRAIAAFLDRETARIDALIIKIQMAIDSLGEHRIALISAAVTGRIDVRNEL